VEGAVCGWDADVGRRVVLVPESDDGEFALFIVSVSSLAAAICEREMYLAVLARELTLELIEVE